MLLVCSLQSRRSKNKYSHRLFHSLGTEKESCSNVVVPTKGKRVAFYGMRPHSTTTFPRPKGGQRTNMSVCDHIGHVVRQNSTNDGLSNVVEEWSLGRETTGKDTQVALELLCAVLRDDGRTIVGNELGSCARAV